MKGKILVVDDNSKSLEVLGTILRTNGYSVVLVTSGNNALKLLETDSFDLLLLDNSMPEMGGYEVAAHIRNTAELDSLPIIFLTEKVATESIAKLFRAGGQEYVSKPVESGELLARIATQIELKKSRSALFALNKTLEQQAQERIKDLEEGQMRYQYALEASNVDIWDWDLEADTLDFSDRLYYILGYSPDEFPKTRAEINKRIHPDDLANRSEPGYIASYKNNPDDLIEGEFRMMNKAGHYIWIQTNAKVVARDENNEILRVVGTYADISEHKRKNSDLIQKILEIEDSERRKISQEIHDGLHQTLTLSAMNFSFAKKAKHTDETQYQKLFDTGMDYLQQGISESRVIAQTLMPKAIVDFGIISAFQSLIEEMDMSTVGTEFKLHHNFKEGRLQNHQIELILYRILQEALRNIVKYAEAKNVTIQAKNYEDLVMLTIEDDGKGFDLAAIKKTNKGFGLKIMKDRLKAVYGSLEIESQPNRGTTIIVQIEKNKILSL